MGRNSRHFQIVSQPYLSLEAELHDAFWNEEEDGSELRLMTDFLRKHPGPALEIGSGSGRLMFPLLQAGFEVEGLELSPDMRALGDARAAELGLKPLVHAGDMGEWLPDRRYAALLAPAFTLQLAVDPAATLRHWHGWLENRGGLYLTIFTPHAELEGFLPEGEWYEDHRASLPDGITGLLETRHRLDVEKQLLFREHRYSLSGKPPLTHRSKQTIRWFVHGEMPELLASSGFRLECCFMDFDPGSAGSDIEQDDGEGIFTYHAVRLG
jgi:SAM-dependent methyltransferase